MAIITDDFDDEEDAQDPLIYLQLPNGNFTAKEVPVTQPWQLSVSPSMRNSAVFLMVKSLSPVSNPLSLAEEDLNKLIEEAREIEAGFFQTQNAKSKYLHALAEAFVP